MQETLARLRASLVPIYGKGEAEAIIRLIFHHLKGWNLTDILIHGNDELSDFIKGQISEIEKRLLKHEPIQYIIGEARFYGMDMKIRPGVLIPRPETEELTDIIIDQNKGRDDLKVLDLCTGSGCIAIALARNLPFSKVTAVDVSPTAIEVAEENSKLLKTKIEIKREDIFEWEPSDKYDIIVSNPPYVLDREIMGMEANVKDYEPHEALFVRDEEPLRFYKRIANIAKIALKDKGRLYLELNPLTAEELKEYLEKEGFNSLTLLKDSHGKVRFLECSLEKN